jgi:hypothetical protein
MLSPQALIRGIVQSLLPSSNVDSTNNDVALRLDAYGGQFVQARVRKTHALAKEGSYFVTNNAQSGIAMTATAVFAATTPFIVIQNNATIGGKSINLDYINLVTTAAGSAASGLTLIQATLVLDSILRYTSGGSNLTSNKVSPNMALASAASIASIYCGAITAAAAGALARTLCGVRTVRPCVSATVADVIGETKLFNFGGVEAMLNGSITVANANNVPVPMPPCIIGPQQSALLYLYYAAAGTPVAASYAPEVAWWEE